MITVTKKLKFATFEYDGDNKTFIIKGNLLPDTEPFTFFTLNKIYAFALQRFIIRIAQKEFGHGRKDKKNKTSNSNSKTN